MLIQEACKQCGLTKKALEYYESKELVAPKVLENGYRDYTEEQVERLKEISVLRQCGLGVGEIKEIFSSPNRPAALERYRYLCRLKKQRLEAAEACMDRLIRDYDPHREFCAMQSRDENLLTIKERLVLAFPGSYGMFLALHFGRFLDEPVDI